MEPTRLQELFGYYYTKTITADQRAELMQLIHAASADELALLVTSSGESLVQFEPVLSDLTTEAMLQKILKKTVTAPVRKIYSPNQVRGRVWKKIAVAASVLLVLGLGSYFLFFNKAAKQQEIVTTTTKDIIAPQKNRATITFTNGKIIYLDSAGNGTLAIAGNVTVTKNDNGEIVYNGSAKTVEYNTLFNPRGSKVQPLTLSDGTKLWLNAESSVTYPTAFVGNERKVTITGEAYFEVAHDAAHPFIVTKGATSVTVLGTHFNVNAYDDEKEMKITLLEGSVKINNDKILKPGQQARVTGDIKVVNGVDVEEVMAWKNGFFKFNRSSLAEVMRQLARWYDIEVRYEGPIPERTFGGKISRETNASQVLKILQESDVHFRMEDRRIIVTP